MHWLQTNFLKTELELGHCLRLPQEGPCECDLVLSCSKFLTTSDYAPRLHARLAVEQQLIEDATARGWQREIERHTATHAPDRATAPRTRRAGRPRTPHTPRPPNGEPVGVPVIRRRDDTCGDRPVQIIEADLIRLRTKEGMRIAKAKGRLRGKQPKLNPRQEAHLVALLKSGEYSTAEIGDLFGVARSTVYRAIGREAARQRAQRSGTGPIR